MRRQFSSGVCKDIARIYAGKSNAEMVRTGAILSACGTRPVIAPAIATLSLAERDFPMLKNPSRYVVRRTVWPHFCAGERIEDCKKLLDSLSPYGVSLIVDHSVEERENPEDWAENLEGKKRLLRQCQEILGLGVAFVPVKITALASPRLLEEMTRIILSHPNHFDEIVDVESSLTDEDRGLLRVALQNLGDLCEAAKRTPGLSLALDAEQSHRQPAIDFIATHLMRRYNCSDSERSRPLLYNTVQCYMIGARRRLRRDLNLAREGGYAFGVKLVRGAYLSSERERASKDEAHSAFPLRASKDETDIAYDRSLADVLQSVADRSESVGVLIATHNSTSVDRATSLMHDLGVSNAHPSVHFATIMGMSDHLTIGLGLSGYNALKLALFGTFEDIYPWLLRRLEENQDVLGGAHDERRMIFSELRRRIGI